MFREEWWRSRQGKKVLQGRCGRTIEAKPFSGQTCLIEPPRGSAGDNEEEEHGDSSTVRSHLFKRLIGETAPDARSFAANISVWSSAEAPVAWIHTRYIVAARIVLPERIHAQADKAVHRRNQVVPQAEIRPTEDLDRKKLDLRRDKDCR